MKPRYNLPLPFGWFAVAYSDELAIGDVRPLQYFDRELVLFRTQSGQAKVLDAICPHLGAHLGHGGTVKGESIACPFHGWQFDGDGFCTEVPYATNMPPKVVGQPCIPHYPVVEDNQAVWMWFHPQGEAPHWPLDHVDEMNDPEFWTQSLKRDWIVKCHIQDTNENSVDKAHFAYVHTSAGIPDGDVFIDGHRKTTALASQTPAFSADGKPLEGQYVDTNFISKSFGPGFTWQLFRGITHSMMMGMVTPIDHESVHLRFYFKHPTLSTEIEEIFNTGFIENICSQVEQDMKIWNHKHYQPNPILCDGDGPINQFRKWFQQFYV